jgi:hypothetical protein
MTRTTKPMIAASTVSQSGIIVASRAFISTLKAGRLDKEYEVANTLQPKCIFNLRRMNAAKHASSAIAEEVSGRQLKANYCEAMGHSVWPQLMPDIGTRAANQVDKHDERCSDGDPEG